MIRETTVRNLSPHPAGDEGHGSGNSHAKNETHAYLKFYNVA